MLQAGASPSAGLIGKSGYESEYVKVLENYYKQQAAAKASGGGRSGGGTGGGGKPKSKMSLTTAQKMAKAGQFTQEVLDTLHAGGFNDAYLASEYGYTGGGSGRTKFGYDPDEGIFTWNGYRFNSPEAFAEALDRAALTDAEKAEISRKLKANGFNITF